MLRTPQNLQKRGPTPYTFTDVHPALKCEMPRLLMQEFGKPTPAQIMGAAIKKAVLLRRNSDEIARAFTSELQLPIECVRMIEALPLHKGGAILAGTFLRYNVLQRTCTTVSAQECFTESNAKSEIVGYLDAAQIDPMSGKPTVVDYVLSDAPRANMRLRGMASAVARLVGKSNVLACQYTINRKFQVRKSLYTFREEDIAAFELKALKALRRTEQSLNLVRPKNTTRITTGTHCAGCKLADDCHENILRQR